MMNKYLRTLGWIGIITGACLVAVIGIIAMWGDIEATVFNAAIRSKKPLSSLRCPVVITPQDKASISARIHNPSDRELEMEIRTYISDGEVVLMKEFISNFVLKPDESEIVSIPIKTSHAAFDRVVLVRMHQIRRGPLPYLNASCGVIKLDIPLITGPQFVIITLSLGSLLSIVGWILWILNTKPIEGEKLKDLYYFGSFSIISILITLTAILGWWLLTVFLVVIWVLLGVGKITQSAITSRRKA
jgi:hypothetical protein